MRAERKCHFEQGKGTYRDRIRRQEKANSLLIDGRQEKIRKGAEKDRNTKKPAAFCRSRITGVYCRVKVMRTGLWSEQVKLKSRVSTASGMTLSETIKPSMR